MRLVRTSLASSLNRARNFSQTMHVMPGSLEATSPAHGESKTSPPGTPCCRRTRRLGRIVSSPASSKWRKQLAASRRTSASSSLNRLASRPSHQARHSGAAMFADATCATPVAHLTSLQTPRTPNEPRRRDGARRSQPNVRRPARLPVHSIGAFFRRAAGPAQSVPARRSR